MSLSETANANASKQLVFPEGFLWGSATSSFQIEGAPTADGRSASIWDTFCSVPGNIKDGSNGDVACDHYNRYVEDVALMKSLGLDAYRFSMAWTRVIPGGTGAVNEAGLDFYDRLVDELLGAGIQPFPTFYHWDLPQCLEDQGGWVNRDTAYAFADYAEAVVARLGDRIGTFTTLNEPFVSADHGYVTGEHAPGHESMEEGLAASHHLLLGHGLAGQRIRSGAPDARLGIVLNFTDLEPATDSEADRTSWYHRNHLENHWYSDPVFGLGYPEDTADYVGWDRSQILEGDMDIIAAPIDLLGVNFYTRDFESADDSFELPEGTPQNTMGWELHPPSFGKLLRWINDRYDVESILITENGCPMPDNVRDDTRVIDDDRIDFVRTHMAQVHGAIQDGVPVEGYLVWSLFDNFEWAWGYGPTFGIVEVNYETLERIPKKSALWFSESKAQNGFEI